MKSLAILLSSILLFASGCGGETEPSPAQDASGEPSDLALSDTITSDAGTEDVQASEDVAPTPDSAPPTPMAPPSLQSSVIFEPGAGDATPRVQVAVALGHDDDVAAVWTGAAGEDNALGIRFALHHLDGSVKVAALPLFTSSQGIQNEPSICTLSDGRYVAAWSRDTQSVGPDGENLEIRFRLIDADGTPVGENDSRVLSDAPGNHWLAEVACGPDGGFVIAGVRPDTDDITFGAFAWRFDENGAPNGDAMALNLKPEGTQTYPDVAVNADGAVIATWNDDAEVEPGQPLDRVLLRWLPPAPAEAGEIIAVAGEAGAPASYGQVASGSFDTEARVAAALSDGTIGLWTLNESGVTTTIQLPGGGGAMTNPALAAIQPETYAVAFQHGAGETARLEVAILGTDSILQGPTIIESGPQLPYALSLDGAEGKLALGWTVKNDDGEYIPRVAIFRSPGSGP